MKRRAFARQTDPSARIPMPGLCRDFGRDWEGNEKDGGVECLDADDPHWLSLIKDGALIGVERPGADNLAPIEGYEGPVRRAFEAFGLAKDDEETWDLVKRNVDLLAREYNRLSPKEAIPKPREIREQLEDVQKAAKNFAAALAALSEPAFDWMLAFDPPSPLHPRSGEGGQSPGQAPGEFLRVREAALGTELAAYEDFLAEWANGPLTEDQARYIESLVDLKRAEATADDIEIAKAQRRALLLKPFGSTTPPAPYCIRDWLAGKARAIAALAKKAGARAAEHGPPNPANKPDRRVLGRTPHDWLVECCLDLIERTFGAEGLRKVKAYRPDSTNKEGAALIVDLLRAVEQYATAIPPASFSQAVNRIVALRDERLRRLDELASGGGKSAKGTATPM